MLEANTVEYGADRKTSLSDTMFELVLVSYDGGMMRDADTDTGWDSLTVGKLCDQQNGGFLDCLWSYTHRVK